MKKYNNWTIDNFIKKNNDLSEREIAQTLQITTLRVQNSKRRLEKQKKKIFKPLKKLKQYSEKRGGENVIIKSPSTGRPILLDTFKVLVMNRMRKNFCQYPKCCKKETECFEVHHIYKQRTAQKKIDSHYMITLCWICHQKTMDSYPYFGTAIEADTEKRVKQNKEINKFCEDLRPFIKKALQEVVDQELELFKKNS